MPRVNSIVKTQENLVNLMTSPIWKLFSKIVWDEINFIEIEWFGLEGTQVSSNSSPPAISMDTFL